MLGTKDELDKRWCFKVGLFRVGIVNQGTQEGVEFEESKVGG